MDDILRPMRNIGASRSPGVDRTREARSGTEASRALPLGPAIIYTQKNLPSLMVGTDIALTLVSNQALPMREERRGRRRFPPNAVKRLGSGEGPEIRPLEPQYVVFLPALDHV